MLITFIIIVVCLTMFGDAVQKQGDLDSLVNKLKEMEE